MIFRDDSDPGADPAVDEDIPPSRRFGQNAAPPPPLSIPGAAYAPNAPDAPPEGPQLAALAHFAPPTGGDTGTPMTPSGGSLGGAIGTPAVDPLAFTPSPLAPSAQPITAPLRHTLSDFLDGGDAPPPDAAPMLATPQLPSAPATGSVPAAPTPPRTLLGMLNGSGDAPPPNTDPVLAQAGQLAGAAPLPLTPVSPSAPRTGIGALPLDRPSPVPQDRASATYLGDTGDARLPDGGTDVAPSNTGAGSGGVGTGTPAQQAPTAPDPVLGTPSSTSGSSIFAADPTLPGSGYVNYNGQQYRIEGTTAAGLGADGQPKPVTANDHYLLDDGHGGTISGPSVNVSDYNNFVNGYHAPNTVYSDVTGASHQMSDLGTAHQGPLGWGKDGGPQEESYLQDGVTTDAQGNAVQGGYNAATDLARQQSGAPPVNPTPPPSTTPANTGGTRAIGNPNNLVANDVGTPSTPNTGATIAPLGTPIAGSPSGSTATGGTTPTASPSPLTPTPPSLTPPPQGGTLPGGSSSPGTLSGYLQSATSPASQYASMTPTDPNNDLRSQTITPGPALDRFKLAQDQLKTYNDATAPYYDAALRSANQQAAATGRLGSGMLRTSLGDLANQRDLQLQTQGQSFLQDALSGSVSDQQFNLDRLLAEQQYQTQAQNQAFNQNVVGQQLQDSLTNSSFGRALSSLNAGSANDPGSALLALSGIYGNQASGANQSLAQLISGMTANKTGAASNQSLLDWIKSMYGGAAGGTPSTQPVGNPRGATPSYTNPFPNGTLPA